MPITTRHLAFERLFFWQRSLRVAFGILPAMFYNLWFLFTKDSRTWKRVFWSIYHTKFESRGRFWSGSGSFIVLTRREGEKREKNLRVPPSNLISSFAQLYLSTTISFGAFLHVLYWKEENGSLIKNQNGAVFYLLANDFYVCMRQFDIDFNCFMSLIQFVKNVFKAYF